jgi:hypothetical protein
MDWIGAANVGVNALNSAIGLFTTPTINEQINMQKQLTEHAAGLNFRYGEQGAINAQKRAIDQYLKYQSPEAMVAQYKAAGLNPALMYGGGGTGGSAITPGASGSSGNQQGANAAQMYMTQQQAQQNAIQSGLAISQMMKNLTDAKLTKAEVQNVLEELGIKKETHKSKVTEARAIAATAVNKALESKEQARKTGYEADITKIEAGNQKKWGEKNAKIDNWQKAMEAKLTELNAVILELDLTGTQRQYPESPFTKINDIDKGLIWRRMIAALKKEENEANISGENLRITRVEANRIEKYANEITDLIYEAMTTGQRIQELNEKLLEFQYENRWTLEGIKVVNVALDTVKEIANALSGKGKK